MLRNCMLSMLLALSACGDPALKVGVYTGMHGATVATMSARGVRLSDVASDVRFDVRPAARGLIANNQLTEEILKASLDSMANDQDVVAVVTRLLTAGAVAATGTFNNEGVPYISTTPVSSELVGGSTWGFALVPDYRKQAEFIASKIGGARRIAIVHIDDPYGRGMAEALTQALTAVGSAPTDVRSYLQSWDEPRMIALGHETRGESPDLLIFAGRSPSLILVIQPFREAGEEVRVIGTDLIEAEYLYQAGDAALAGVEFVRFMDVTSEDARMEDLRERYVFWIGFGHIITEAVLTHDAVSMLGEAVRAGARTREQVRDYLKSLGRTRPPYSGVGGLIAFGEDGQVERKLELARVTRRGVVAETTDSAAGRR